jgi:hypothetical protein
VDLEESAVLTTSSSRPDTLHDRTVVIVRDNETIECPTTDGQLGNLSKVFFSLDNLDEGTDRTNNWSFEPTLILLCFHLSQTTSK